MQFIFIRLIGIGSFYYIKAYWSHLSHLKLNIAWAELRNWISWHPETLKFMTPTKNIALCTVALKQKLPERSNKQITLSNRTAHKQQGPTRHGPKAHPVVFRYLSYSTTFAEHAVHRLRWCKTFGWARTCLFLFFQ